MQAYLACLDSVYTHWCGKLHTHPAVHGCCSVKLGDGSRHRGALGVSTRWGATSSTSLVAHQSCTVAIVNVVARMTSVVIVAARTAVANGLLWRVSASAHPRRCGRAHAVVGGLALRRASVVGLLWWWSTLWGVLVIVVVIVESSHWILYCVLIR